MGSELLSIRQSKLDTAASALALINTPLLLVSDGAIDTGRAFRHAGLENTLSRVQKNLLSAARSIDEAASDQQQALALIAHSFEAADQGAGRLL